MFHLSSRTEEKLNPYNYLREFIYERIKFKKRVFDLFYTPNE